MELLQVNKIKKIFGGLLAVNDVSMSLAKGEILGLIGPNGAGKSTLFNLISGIIKPDSGNIIFDGTDITRMAPHNRCRNGIARTFQLVKPFNRISPLENVMVGRAYGCKPARNIKQARTEAEEILDITGLKHKQVRMAGTLGLIDRKRLEIARALATRPKLLLLDEVMAGLNQTEIEDTMRLVRQLRDSGISIVVVEHVMKAIMGISDRIIVLATGDKIADGTPQEVINNQRVIEAYLGKKQVC